MKRIPSFFYLLFTVLLVLLAVVVLPVFAEDVPPETASVMLSPLEFVVAILTTAIISIASVVIGIGALANRVLNSPVLIAFLEKLANTASPDLIKQVFEAGRGISTVGELVTEVTDNVPASSKPPVNIGGAIVSKPPESPNDITATN